MFVDGGGVWDGMGRKGIGKLHDGKAVGLEGGWYWAGSKEDFRFFVPLVFGSD